MDRVIILERSERSETRDTQRLTIVMEPLGQHSVSPFFGRRSQNPHDPDEVPVSIQKMLRMDLADL